MTREHATTRPCKKCGALFSGVRCGSCKKLYADAYNKANAEKIKSYVSEWYLLNKEVVNKRSAKYYSENKSKIDEKTSAWQKSNPLKCREYSSKWRSENPLSTRITNQNRRGRIVAAGGILSKGLANKLFKLQKGKCACCKDDLGDNYHLDHIVPLSKGGSNKDENMQLLTQRCNLQKGNKDPIEFMQLRGFLI